MSVHDTFSGARCLQKTLTETIKPLTETIKPLTETIKPHTETIKPLTDTACRNEQPLAETNEPLPGTPEVPGRMKTPCNFHGNSLEFHETAKDFDGNL